MSSTLRRDFIANARGNSKINLLPGSLGRYKSTEAFGELLREPNEPAVFMQTFAANDGQSSNDFAMELLFTMHNARKIFKGPIWIVAPYHGYGRSDKPRPGHLDSVGMEAISEMMVNFGAVGISMIELHSQTGLSILQKKFGNDNVYNLEPTDLLVNEALTEIEPGEHVVVCEPDAGSNARAGAVRERLHAGKFQCDKGHESSNVTRIKSFGGDDVKGKKTFTIDDIIDTAGTIINSQIVLADEGATTRIVQVAHPVLSGDALYRVYTAKTNDDKERAISRLVVLDTIETADKIESLKKQFNTDDIDEVGKRIKVLHTGDMIYNHVVRDLLNHPAMQPR